MESRCSPVSAEARICMGLAMFTTSAESFLLLCRSIAPPLAAAKPVAIQKNRMTIFRHNARISIAASSGTEAVRARLVAAGLGRFPAVDPALIRLEPRAAVAVIEH